MKSCVFCDPDREKSALFKGKWAYVLADNHPVTKHHCLIIPIRHFASFFEITAEELLDIKSLLIQCKNSILAQDPSVEGFNIGINDGLVAGQSVFHLHIHLIPRRTGDIDHPKGGVRGIIPEKRAY